MEVDDMINNVKPGYVNPLTMVGSSKNKQAKPLYLEGIETAEKRKRSLEAEKQSIQNSLLLMKGTSGDAGSSEENIELLEKKLEAITKELEANRQETMETVTAKEERVEESGELITHNHFDTYEKSEHKESAGYYKVVNDDNKGYKIEYDVD